MTMFFAFLFGLLSTSHAEQRNWSQGTADVLPKGRWETGVFSPFRIGIRDGTELDFHPLWAILAPHISIKQQLQEKDGWRFAVRQSISYPTHLLRFFSKAGIAGIIPPDVAIPHIVGSDTSLLATRDLNDNHQFTGWFRVKAGFGIGESTYHTIDAPLVYPRTAVLQNGIGAEIGVRFAGSLIKDLGYRVDVEGWWLPTAEGSFFQENYLYATWQPSSRFSAQVGCITSYGQFPYGDNWHIMPGFDLMFAK